MKMNFTKREQINKTTFLLLGMMFLGFASARAQVDTAGQIHPTKTNSIHQQPQAPTPTQSNPQTPTQAYPASPQSMPMDTLKKNHGIGTTHPADPNTAAPTKLTEAQIKILVGKDMPVGRDVHGHQLYKDSTRMIYYVADGGTKVYVK